MGQTQKMLLEEIKKTGFQVRAYYSRADLDKIAQEEHISLTYNHHVREEGWINKTKESVTSIVGAHRNVADIEKSYIDKEYEAEICSQ